METQKNSKTGDILLATNPHKMSFLQYQLVYCYRNEKQLLRSFNILIDDKIIRKVYLPKMVQLTGSVTPEMIIANTLFCSANVSSQSKTTFSKKENSTKKAGGQATKKGNKTSVNNLFSNLDY